MRIAEAVRDSLHREGNRMQCYAGALTLSAVVASLAIRPYATYLVAQLQPAQAIGPSFFSALEVLVVNAGLSYLLIVMSLHAARHLGLAWPPIDGWGTGAEAASRRREAVVTAILLGAAAALVVTIGSLLIGDRWILRPIHAPPIWMAALASPGAGIYEEIWFRLAAMTLVAWLLKQVTRRSGSDPGILWTASLGSALLFGAAHLPQTSGLAPLTPSLIAAVLVGNGCIGMACGWLYWRRGLMAAMIAHTTADLVLKVAIPLIGGSV
jgi:membrane protease YdiL (CAAX protease family)